jgi:outer membrane protein assembly factor BamE (lipoprotein component of BamABCDE complex)
MDLRRPNRIIAAIAVARVDKARPAAEAPAVKSARGLPVLTKDGFAASFDRRVRLANHGGRACSMAAAAAVLAIAGCSPNIELRGDLPTREQIAQIHPGKTTKDQVVKILGSPSSVSVFDANAWYYISKRTSQSAFFLPNTTDQQVYIVDFTKDGVVSAVDHKGLKDAENITPAPGATPAPGRELTFLEQIIGNLGRFSGGAGGNTSTSGGGSNGPSPNKESHPGY